MESGEDKAGELLEEINGIREILAANPQFDVLMEHPGIPKQEKLQVELLANLDQVSPAGAVVIVSYPRIEGATGLPARVWAITE